MIKVKAVDREQKVREIYLQEVPDKCPICHHGIDPRMTAVCVINGAVVQLALVYPMAACQRIFIAQYLPGRADNSYNLHGVTPIEPVDDNYSKIINSISNDFVLIFNQAHKAEQKGWSLVAGPGYRKALEFLIKDYLVFLDPESRAKVEKMQLSNCIADHVKSEQIQKTAARAAWLGNDETHYVRKWEGKDVSDLKTLIALTVRWIEMVEMTKELDTSMPEGKS